MTRYHSVAFVQERRSEESLEALNKLVPHHCHLTRDSAALTTLANGLVPGDIVSFSTGDRIPADVRLFAAQGLEVDESSLTGETDARRKDVEPCAPGLPLAERSSMVYMGTLVRAGRGSGVVVATGKETEFGLIFSMMEEVWISASWITYIKLIKQYRLRKSEHPFNDAWTSLQVNYLLSHSESSALSVLRVSYNHGRGLKCLLSEVGHHQIVEINKLTISFSFARGSRYS
jgi:magnesium-transporting ATPase (P-type)